MKLTCLAVAAASILCGAASAETIIGQAADPRIEDEAPIPSGVRVGPGRGDVMPEIYPTAVVSSENEWAVEIDGELHRTGDDVGDWRIMAVAPGVVDVQHGFMAWKIPVPRR